MKTLLTLLISICIVVMFGLVVGTIASAGDTVTATVTIGTVSVTLNQTAFDYGAMPYNTSKASFTTTGVLNGKNISATVGTVVTDLGIKGAVTADWTTLAAAPGANTYVHSFGTAADETHVAGSYTALTTSSQSLSAGVAANGVIWFGLQITTPTSGVATQQSAAVQVIATWHG
jgi:hypothetical protein